MKKTLYFLSVMLISIFSVLIIKNPQICVNAISGGLILCSRVIIPSLYPFTFCVLFILNSGVLNTLKPIDFLSTKIFGMPFYLFSVFMLSLIGGYPLGAKLINDSVTDKDTARIMQNYCVNAGPAFIITAVGTGAFGSQKIGLILFFAHIIPALILALLFRKQINFSTDNTKKPLGLTDNFVTSASAAASALINICGFVVLFSVICAYANTQLTALPFSKPLCMLLEVTNGINMTRNIFTVSFLLGFGGVCIWCQVFAINKNAKPSILLFALCRIFHGLSSVGLTFIGIKVFKISLPTISNQKIFTYGTFTDTASVGISLIIMGIVLIISLKNKNYAGNILEDIV